MLLSVNDLTLTLKLNLEDKTINPTHNIWAHQNKTASSHKKTTAQQIINFNTQYFYIKMI